MELPTVINVAELLAPHPPRTNFNLFWVDDQYTLRVATIEDAFPWHYHPASDEGWYVINGRIRIRTELGDVELGAGESTVVRRGLKHSPLCLAPRTTVLIVNSREFETVYLDEDIDDQAASYRELEVGEL